mmetsp:Transcript_7243/g.16388  ORF Transcript_7243/g.16388 Transcript_7243/m.16388 type:complete len:328 (-) Transcript_7243:255-1238(-)
MPHAYAGACCATSAPADCGSSEARSDASAAGSCDVARSPVPSSPRASETSASGAGCPSSPSSTRISSHSACGCPYCKCMGQKTCSANGSANVAEACRLLSTSLREQRRSIRLRMAWQICGMWKTRVPSRRTKLGASGVPSAATCSTALEMLLTRSGQLTAEGFSNIDSFTPAEQLYCPTQNSKRLCSTTATRRPCSPMRSASAAAKTLLPLLDGPPRPTSITVPSERAAGTCHLTELGSFWSFWASDSAGFGISFMYSRTSSALPTPVTFPGPSGLSNFPARPPETLISISPCHCSGRSWKAMRRWLPPRRYRNEYDFMGTGFQSSR